MARYDLHLFVLIPIQMFEHFTAATRASATTGNWRSPGLDMVLDQRMREYLLGLAMSPVSAGGFSTDQLKLLNILPNAREMLGMEHAPQVHVPRFVECLHESRESITFFKVTAMERSPNSSIVFENLRELISRSCAANTPAEVIQTLGDSLRLELSKFISEEDTTGSI